MLVLDSLIFYILSIILIAGSIFACFVSNLYYATIFLYIFLFGLSFISFAMKTPLNGVVSMLFGCICTVLLLMFVLFTIKPNSEKKCNLKLKENIIFLTIVFALCSTALAFILTKIRNQNTINRSWNHNNCFKFLVYPIFYYLFDCSDFIFISFNRSIYDVLL